MDTEKINKANKIIQEYYNSGGKNIDFEKGENIDEVLRVLKKIKYELLPDLNIIFSKKDMPFVGTHWRKISKVFMSYEVIYK